MSCCHVKKLLAYSNCKKYICSDDTSRQTRRTATAGLVIQSVINYSCLECIAYSISGQGGNCTCTTDGERKTSGRKGND